jgi:PKD repeat protein
MAIIINTIEELQLIGNDAGYPLDGDYELGNDIDASVTSTWNGGAGFDPIGNLADFTGTFDGKYFKITNLYIYRPSMFIVGLFSVCDSGAEISNLILDNVNIVGQDITGSLCGIADEHGSACTIYNVKSSGSVLGGSQVGGLIGLLESGEVFFCSSGCTVSGVNAVGGLIGEAKEATVVHSCFSSGVVFATGQDVGGFIGEADVCTVSRCFSTGNVTGGNDTGGFIGDFYASTVSDCYCTGNVVGNSDVGGFVGDLDFGFTITNCYCTGNVVGNSDVGGFSGDAPYGVSVISCFWDTETSGVLVSSAGEGKTTAEMQTQSTFVGWDFETLWGLSAYDEYKYPKFLCADFSATQVSGEAPLEVGFTNSSIDEAFPVETFLWDFGDGSYSSEENPTHTYTTSGEFTAILTITYGDFTSIDKDFITVSSLSPVAEFSGSPLIGAAPLIVAFNDASTEFPTSWLWDFGDSGSSTEQDPVHTYSLPGVYSVTLTASSDLGGDTITKIDYITVGDNNVDFSITPPTGAVSQTFLFTDLSTGPTAIESWLWDFGDSVTSSNQNPTHTYSLPGVYTVTLLVEGFEYTDSTSKSLTVTPNLTSLSFSATPRVGTIPHTVSFIDDSVYTGMTSKLWSFGDGFTYDGSHMSFSYTYDTAGLYTVSLTVINSEGTIALVKEGYIAVNPDTPTPSFILAKSDSAGEGKYWNFYLDVDGHLVFENESYTHRSVDKIYNIKKWAFVQFNPGPNKMYVGDSTRFIREIDMVTTSTSLPESPSKKKLYSSLNSSFVIDELKIWYGDKNLTEYFKSLWGAAERLSQ